MNSPPMSVHRPEGNTLEKAAAFHRVNDFLRQHSLLGRTKARRVHNGGDKAWTILKRAIISSSP